MQLIITLRRVDPELASLEQMNSRQVFQPFTWGFRRYAQDVEGVEFVLRL